MIFDLTANSGKPKKLPVLDAGYPQDVSKTIIKGNTATATFAAVISEHGYPTEYSYQWYVDGTAVSGATGPTFTLSKAPTATTTYSVYCIVTNKAGAVQSRTASVTVTVQYTPTLNASYPANATVTIQNSVTCKVAISTAGNPASYTYQWYKNGTAVSGATSASYTFTPTAVGTTTVYCKVTNSAGTVTSRTATITAEPFYLIKNGQVQHDISIASLKPGTSGYAATVTTTQNTDNILYQVKTPETGVGAGAMFYVSGINIGNFGKLSMNGHFYASIHGTKNLLHLATWSALGTTSTEENLTASQLLISNNTSEPLDVDFSGSLDLSAMSGAPLIGFKLKVLTTVNLSVKNLWLE